MAIYLIRHGHAGNRSSWRGDDYDRPLSDKGRSQAEFLVKLLDDEPIKRVISSPARRCVETVEPLAEHLELKIKLARELEEGAEPNEAIAFLLDNAKHNPALSSHGDLIPKIIRRLAAAGMRTKDANISQKGSVWVLEVDDGQVVKGRYQPPG